MRLLNNVLLFVCVLVLPVLQAHSETFQFNTYYPSPYGSYDRLNSSSLKLTQQIADPFICDATQYGAMYYSSLDKCTKQCTPTDWQCIGGSAALSRAPLVTLTMNSTNADLNNTNHGDFNVKAATDKIAMSANIRSDYNDKVVAALDLGTSHVNSITIDVKEFKGNSVRVEMMGAAIVLSDFVRTSYSAISYNIPRIDLNVQKLNSYGSIISSYVAQKIEFYSGNARKNFYPEDKSSYVSAGASRSYRGRPFHDSLLPSPCEALIADYGTSVYDMWGIGQLSFASRNIIRAFYFYTVVSGTTHYYLAFQPNQTTWYTSNTDKPWFAKYIGTSKPTATPSLPAAPNSFSLDDLRNLRSATSYHYLEGVKFFKKSTSGGDPNLDFFYDPSMPKLEMSEALNKDYRCYEPESFSVVVDIPIESSVEKLVIRPSIFNGVTNSSPISELRFIPERFRIAVIPN